MTAMGFGGVCGGPVMGHIFDSTTRKRLVIVLALVMTGTTYLVLAQSREFALVASAMIIQGIVASAYGPGINAISLGIVQRSLPPERCARNEIFKHWHIGVLISAVIPILLIPRIGYTSYFVFLPVVGMTGAWGQSKSLVRR